jgi:hypothetical protein
LVDRTGSGRRIDFFESSPVRGKLWADIICRQVICGRCCQTHSKGFHKIYGLHDVCTTTGYVRPDYVYGASISSQNTECSSGSFTRSAVGGFVVHSDNGQGADGLPRINVSLTPLRERNCHWPRDVSQFTNCEQSVVRHINRDYLITQ